MSENSPLDDAVEKLCESCVQNMLRWGRRPSERTMWLLLRGGRDYEKRRRILFMLLPYVGVGGLRRAGCGFYTVAVAKGDAEVVELFLQAGYGRKCGCVAGRAPDAEMFKSLVEAGGCVKYSHIQSPEVLRAAVELLGPRHADRDGNTPLHVAAAFCDVELIGRLLDAGADPTAKNKRGETPLHVAVRNKCIKGVALMAERADSVPRGVLEIATGDIAVLAALMPHLRTGVNKDALARAAVRRRNQEAAALLLQDPNARDRRGRTLLHLAARHCAPQLAELLIEAGADPNARDKDGKTPLHHAAEAGCREVAALLLSRGAHPVVYDNDGRTPLWYAERVGHKLAELLRSGGAFA